MSVAGSAKMLCLLPVFTAVYWVLRSLLSLPASCMPSEWGVCSLVPLCLILGHKGHLTMSRNVS